MYGICSGFTGETERMFNGKLGSDYINISDLIWVSNAILVR